MFTQVITTNEDHVTLEVPQELRGHKIEVTMNDLETIGHNPYASVEDVLSHFTAIKIDTRGFKFNRDEANQR